MKELYEIYLRGEKPFSKSLFDSFTCESCIFAKMSRLPYSRKAIRRASRPGEVCYSDIGVLPVATFSGCRYFVVFMDEYTRYVFTKMIVRKSDIYDAFEEYRKETRGNVNWIYYNIPGIEEEADLLRSDNAKEYKKLGRIVKTKYGTRIRFTQVYTPQDNGIAERQMRMIMEKARAFLYDGHHPVILIDEAIMMAVTIINVTPTAVLDGDSPHERWFRNIPATSHFRSFGCLAYRHVPKDMRNKVEDRAFKCIFVGYNTQQGGYKLLRLSDLSVIEAKDVAFIKNKPARIPHEVLSVYTGDQTTSAPWRKSDRLSAKPT
jgi:transposase InsO family protein